MNAVIAPAASKTSETAWTMLTTPHLKATVELMACPNSPTLLWHML
jgi:hypothetical protein